MEDGKQRPSIFHLLSSIFGIVSYLNVLCTTCVNLSSVPL